MLGLAGMPASGASLLLNAEAVLTVAIAWLVFRERANRRTVAGFALILAGVLVLGWRGQALSGGWWPRLALLGACLGLALDNNLTRAVTSVDATWLAMMKGLVAGSVNLVVALLLGNALPAPLLVVGAMGLGSLSYGLSLVLFIMGLRSVGTARAGAYFSTAPFFGGLVAVVLASRSRHCSGWRPSDDRRCVAPPERAPGARAHPRAARPRPLIRPPRAPPARP